MSLRSQLQGFALGSAIVGAIAMYQLQKDVWSSHRMILTAVRLWIELVITGTWSNVLLFQHEAFTTCTTSSIQVHAVGSTVQHAI